METLVKLIVIILSKFSANILKMTSSVLYTKGLNTICTHLQSNTQIETDAPVDNNGNGQSFSPTDLLATSLAACMLTVMGIKAQTMGFDINDLKMDVQKIMNQQPRKVCGINILVEIPISLIQLEPKQIQILIKTAQTCPVMQSIHPDIQVNIDWGLWK